LPLSAAIYYAQALVRCDALPLSEADRLELTGLDKNTYPKSGAEEEARKISARTRAALEAAKARAIFLGGFRGRQLTDAERAKGNALKTSKARARAESLAPILNELRATGIVTLRALADGLNARGIVEPRGGAWQAIQVKRLLSIPVT
jgi:DNA invertase Pin-like site-specific DNA recombinase